MQKPGVHSLVASLGSKRGNGDVSYPCTSMKSGDGAGGEGGVRL